jgi:hypothetical protein
MSCEGWRAKLKNLIMKKIIMLGMALTAISFSSQAQNLSTGVRTGGSFWMDMQEDVCPSEAGTNGQNKTWDKEIFFRYQTKGKLALDVSMGHYGLKHTEGVDGMIVDPGPGGYIYQGLNERSQNIEWNLSAQYELNLPCLQACPLMKKMDNYIGLVMSPTLSLTKTEVSYHRLNDGSNHVASRTDNQLNLWTGISHTMIFRLNEQFNIMSVVAFRAQMDRLFEGKQNIQGYPDSRMSWQIGLGYSL